MSSILSGTAKLAAWTLAGAIVTAAMVSSPNGAALAPLRALLGGSDADSAPSRSVVDASPSSSPAGAGQLRLEDEVVLRAGRGGNFHTEAEIGGQTIPMMVDTGASMVVLSYEQADRLGFRPLQSEFRYLSQTANGVSRFARISLPYLRVGSLRLDNVVAAVGSPGAIGREGLLGMTFLGRLRSYQVSDGELVLRN